MGDIIDLFEYRKAQETRHILLETFQTAANPLYIIDVTRLVENARLTGGWDLPEGSSIATPTGRAAFAVSQAQTIAPVLARAFPALNEHEVELQISDKLEKIANRFFQQMEGGVSWANVRSAWPHAINEMVDDVTEILLPRIHRFSRSGAPDPRNG